MIPTALCTAYPYCLKGSPGRVNGAVPGHRVPDARYCPDRAGGRQGVVELNGIAAEGGGRGRGVSAYARQRDGDAAATKLDHRQDRARGVEAECLASGQPRLRVEALASSRRVARFEEREDASEVLADRPGDANERAVARSARRSQPRFDLLLRVPGKRQAVVDRGERLLEQVRRVQAAVRLRDLLKLGLLVRIQVPRPLQ